MIGGWKYEVGDIVKQEPDYKSYNYRYTQDIYVIDGYYTTRSGAKHYVVINTYGHASLYDKTAIESTYRLFGKRNCPVEAPKAEESISDLMSAYGMCR